MQELYLLISILIVGDVGVLMVAVLDFKAFVVSNQKNRGSKSAQRFQLPQGCQISCTIRDITPDAATSGC